MDTGFCTHLEDYATEYATAKEAYRSMMERLEAVVREAGRDDRDIELLEEAVEDWESAVHRLRDLFAAHVRRGDVEPSPETADAAGAAPNPVCRTCGAAVPRLNWPQWRMEEEVSAVRGIRSASRPEPEPAR